jgi:hypothetical protein
MRSRASGGYEPDDRDQAELVELWHLSRAAVALPRLEREALFARHGSERSARLNWVVDQFLARHVGESGVARKWVYVWAERNLRPVSLDASNSPPLGGEGRPVRGRGRGRGRGRVPAVDMSWLGPPPVVSGALGLTPAQIERDLAELVAGKAGGR